MRGQVATDRCRSTPFIYIYHSAGSELHEYDIICQSYIKGSRIATLSKAPARIQDRGPRVTHLQLLGLLSVCDFGWHPSTKGASTPRPGGGKRYDRTVIQVNPIAKPTKNVILNNLIQPCMAGDLSLLTDATSPAAKRKTRKGKRKTVNITNYP